MSYPLQQKGAGMTARQIQLHLRTLGSPEAAAIAAGYFKTGPGQYGEGDVFLGLRAAVMHALAKEHRELHPEEILVLLRSEVHEDRLLALLIMVRRTAKGTSATKQETYDLYLKNTQYVNNWDLVDASAREIV
jgi:3-methyladenine DNA glycosylase AlkD